MAGLIATGETTTTYAFIRSAPMVAKAIKPDYGLSSHVAALGVVFSRGETLSPQFATVYSSVNTAVGTAIRSTVIR